MQMLLEAECAGESAREADVWTEERDDVTAHNNKNP